MAATTSVAARPGSIHPVLDFSPEKMMFIFLIVMLVLGPEKLPEVSRKLGRAMGELRKVSGGFRAEMNNAMREMTSDTGGGDRPASNGSDTPAPTSPGTSTDEASGT